MNTSITALGTGITALVFYAVLSVAVLSSSRSDTRKRRIIREFHERWSNVYLHNRCVLMKKIKLYESQGRLSFSGKLHPHVHANCACLRVELTTGYSWVMVSETNPTVLTRIIRTCKAYARYTEIEHKHHFYKLHEKKAKGK